MRITKQVPTEPALYAAHAAADAHGIDEARDWIEDRDLFDHTQVALADARRWAGEVPKTPMGKAWAAALTASAALAEADGYRGYDMARLDEEEKATSDALNALADEVAAASPLLADIATTIRWSAHNAERTLSEWAEQRATITSERILIHRWENHDRIEFEVPWAHIDPIMATLRPRLGPLLSLQYAHLPAFESEQVDGTSRTPKKAKP